MLLMHMRNRSKLRVFHGLVNYGTQSGILAKGLKDFNVKAHSYTKRDIYERVTDYHFQSRKSLLGKIFYNGIWNHLISLSCFFRYDIFHFYYGTSLLPRQLDLPFYRIFGKKVLMHYLGNDVELYKWSMTKYAITNMADIFDNVSGPAHDRKVLKRMKFESKYIDRKIVCSPQYSPFVQEPYFIPLALDLEKFKYTEMPQIEGRPLKIIHAPTSRKKKGTIYLIDAVEKLKIEGYEIELEICEGLTHDQLLERYKNAHISVNALLGGWYGTAGIEAMAIGRPVITYLRESLFHYTSWQEKDVPIINANKNTIYEVLKQTIENKHTLHTLSRKSREFVLKVHDYKKVSSDLLKLYQEL